MYALARTVWNVAKWFWSVVILAFVISYAASAALVKLKDFDFINTVLGWFFLPGLNRLVTISVLVSLAAITILSRIIVAIENHVQGGKALRRHLRSVVERYRSLSPTGISQQSQALISVNVPLEDIFIHLNAVSDRPLYDMPHEQYELQQRLEELRQRSDLNPAELEERIQRLRVVWYSQLGQPLLQKRQIQNISVEEVVQRLTAEKPAAVILGAPGSGKSTSMRWLALHMARALLLSGFSRWLRRVLRLFSFVPFVRTLVSSMYRLPDRLLPAQIPLLLRISDYAKYVSNPKTDDASFEAFFKQQFAQLFPRLQEELDGGHCLVLFDGLDEVAEDSQRRRVTESIATFIANHTVEKATARYYNRFIVTSRIVGYEPGDLAKYAYYTLLELEERQIEQFLTSWCPAVERYQAMFSQGMRKLTPQQELQAQQSGIEQRDRLLEALKNSPGVKRLAINPLTLTILALIQRSGRTLPHRRIELYQTVTRTLLENWNQETGRKFFSIDQIPLVERLLSDLAYQLQSGDSLITEQDVRNVVRTLWTEFYQLPAERVADSTIQEFIDTLRSSSGLFVESGQGLFGFMHRTFQEYYAARYLLRLAPENLQDFVVRHYQSASWREPLLLAIAQKSGESPRQTSALIRAIVDTGAGDESDPVLHRSLLFAANSILDCNVWSIEKALQQDVADGFFDLYGDALGAGSYRKLQQEIEEVALFWLRGQPQESGQPGMWTPLLGAWRAALCSSTNPIRQEGAVHLLTAIAPSLPSCPAPVLLALVPPLLQLADVLDVSLPTEEMRVCLPQPVARPASIRVEEDAFVALRLLDAQGPAGWLHTAWLKWSKDRPELLKHLAEHSRELRYPLTPAALPGSEENPNWSEQVKIFSEWHQDATDNSPNWQTHLLRASTTARYPFAHILKLMLDSELAGPSVSRSWRDTWDTFLQNEMARGRRSTYQLCLDLRLLLRGGNKQQLHELADELLVALSSSGQQQTRSLCAITSVYIRDSLAPQGPQGHQYPRDLLVLLDLLAPRALLDLLDLLTPPLVKRNSLTDRFLQRGLRVFRASLPVLKELVRVVAPGPSDVVSTITVEVLNVSITMLVHSAFSSDQPSLLASQDPRDRLALRALRAPQDQLALRIQQDPRDQEGLRTLRDRLALQELLNREQVVHTLCTKLIEAADTLFPVSLFALYSIINGRYDSIPPSIRQQIQNCLHRSDQQAQSLTRGHRLLITALLRQMEIPADSPAAALEQPALNMPDSDVRAENLRAMKQESLLTRAQVEELLQACMDMRALSERQQVDGADAMVTVQQIAWELLAQPFSLETEALNSVLQALDASEAMLCAAAALLLQRSKTLPQQIRKDAAQKVLTLLKNDESSSRLLDQPDSSNIWRLDNVLFETLKALTE